MSCNELYSLHVVNYCRPIAYVTVNEISYYGYTVSHYAGVEPGVLECGLGGV